MENQMTAEELSKWLEAMIKGIVVFPEEVEIKITKDEMGVLYTLKVNSRDIGRVIGKKGQNVNSIRSILHLAGLHHGIRASLKVDAPELKPEIGERRTY